MAQTQFSYAELVYLCSRFPDPHYAAAVIMAESGGNARASNSNTDGSVDRGLFQINSIHGALSTFEVEANINNAFQISRGGRDWSPWVTVQNGSEQAYIDRDVKPRRPAGGAGAGIPVAPGEAGAEAFAGATASGAVATSGGLFDDDDREGALRALLIVAFVGGGAALAWVGFGQVFGVSPGQLLKPGKALRAAATGPK